MELESDLQPDEILREYEQTPGYEPVFKFKAMLQAQKRSQCASLILLFIMANEAVRIKEKVDNILDGCGAIVVEEDHPKAVFPRLGQEPISEVFRPLLYGPHVDI